MIRQEDVYKIGVIGKPHGIHGELRLHFDDDIFDQCEAEYLILDMEGILVPFFIEEYRFRSEETALMKFCDIDNENAAHRLTGVEVFFPRSIAEASSEHLSWAQIVGFSLIDSATHTRIGSIESVDESTINLLFEVKQEEGQNLLIPAHAELITAIDKENKTIEMNIPDGLLVL